MREWDRTHFPRALSAADVLAPPPRALQLSSRDIEDQAAMLGGWEQRYIQFEKGHFEGAVHSLTLPQSTLFRKTTNRKLHKRFAPPAREVAFAALLPGTEPTLFQGRPVGAGDVLLLSGGQEHELFCHGAFDVIVATFPVREGENAGLVDFTLPRSDVVKGVQATRLCRWLERTLNDTDETWLGPDTDAKRALQEEVARKCVALAAAHGGLGEATERFERVRAVEIFRKMREFVTSHIETFDDFPELSAIQGYLGVSNRTLEYAFKSLLDVSPLRYLTCWRLHCARRDIRRFGPAASITAIATKWGFWHLGRFSIAYRELFGESPSVTVRKASAGARAEVALAHA